MTERAADMQRQESQNGGANKLLKLEHVPQLQDPAHFVAAVNEFLPV